MKTTNQLVNEKRIGEKPFIREEEKENARKKLEQLAKQLNESHNKMKNKLSIEDIENTIIKEEYLKVGIKTTICVLTLKNGFEVVGKSGCVDPNNYDHEIGKKISRERAIDQVWLLEGYKLQEQLNNKQ